MKKSRDKVRKQALKEIAALEEKWYYNATPELAYRITLLRKQLDYYDFIKGYRKDEIEKTEF